MLHLRVFTAALSDDFSLEFDEILFAEQSFEKFSRSSEVLFSYFPFISACLMVSASNIPKYL